MLHSSRGSPSAVHAATVVKQTASWLQGPAREAVGSWQSAHTAQYAARHAALTRHLGTPHLLQTVRTCASLPTASLSVANNSIASIPALDP